MTDAWDERREYPLLSDAGRRMLRRLTEHPSAPRFNYRCGDRLTAAGRDAVRAFATHVQSNMPGHPRPDWLADFVARVQERVPFHRARRTAGDGSFEGLPTCSRHDLARDITAFVPDDAPLEELIVHATSGRTARPLALPHHPTACSCYLPLLEAMLARHGLSLDRGPDRLAIALVADQRSALTCATLSTWLGEAGFVKINLHQSDWRREGDAANYLDELHPGIFTGTPLAFAALAHLPSTVEPRALLSTAMHLSPGARQALQERFACPVVNYYSSMESGPIAVEQDGEFLPLAPDLHIEILDSHGRHVPPHATGEVTLSGGRNPFLPLLRYRTGDWARYCPSRDGGMRCRDLQGRAPVLFLAATGGRVNNIDITRALAHLPLVQFTLHQRADRSVEFCYRGPASEAELRGALEAILGDVPISFSDLPATTSGKVCVYSSEATP